MKEQLLLFPLPKSKRRLRRRLTSGLIPRHPGSKANVRRYSLLDPVHRDVGLIPFAGALHDATRGLLESKISTAIVADSDPGVRAVIRHWIKPGGPEILKAVIELQAKEMMQGEKQARIVFNRCKEILNTALQSPLDPAWELGTDSVHVAAAKVLMHALVFGGNVRTGKGGKINNSLRKDWRIAMTDYRYEMPWYNPNWNVIVFPDYTDVFSWFSESKYKSAWINIDPPYHAPGNGPRVKGGMSKAYCMHPQPNSQSALELFSDAVDLAFKDDRATRVTATNYWGHFTVRVGYLNDGSPVVMGRKKWTSYNDIVELGENAPFTEFSDLGPLQAMNRRKFPDKAGKTELRTVRHEGFWSYSNYKPQQFTQESFINGSNSTILGGSTQRNAALRQHG